MRGLREHSIISNPIIVVNNSDGVDGDCMKGVSTGNGLGIARLRDERGKGRGAEV